MGGWVQRAVVGGLLAGVAMLAAACGEESGGGGAASSGDAVTIATLQPLSGPFASVGQRSLAGVELAVEEINAAGGVKALDGAKLELITADSTSTDQTAAQTVTNQLLRDRPAAIIGPSSSNVELAATTEAERSSVPICGTAYADEITERGYKFTFQLPQKASVVGQEAVPAMENFLAQLGGGIRRIAVINDDSAGIVALNESLIKSLKQTGEFEVVYHQTYPIQLTNAAPLAAGIKRSGAQVVVSGGQIPNILLINKAMQNEGLGNLPRFNPGGGATVTPEYAEALGEFVNGEFAQNLWGFDMQLPEAQLSLLEDLNAEYTSSSQAPFTDAFVGAAYVCTHLFVEAMERAGSSAPADIADVMHSEAFEEGPASLWPPGRVEFDEAGVNAAAVTLVGEWCDGELRTVYPEELASMEPKLPKDCGAPVE